MRCWKVRKGKKPPRDATRKVAGAWRSRHLFCVGISSSHRVIARYSFGDDPGES